MPIAVRIAPKNMTRDDYAKVIADLEQSRGGAPEGRLFHAGYGEDEVDMFDAWDSPERFEPYHDDLVGRLQAAGLDGGMVVQVEPVHTPLPD